MKDLKSYLITDPKFFTNEPEKFILKLKEVLSKHKVDIACFRDKSSSNFEELAKLFLKICREFKIEKVLINTDINLAIKLNFDGVHLNSKQFKEIEEVKKKNLFTIISCHNFDELKIADKLKLDCVTYSPIFQSPNKGEPKGVLNLKKAVNSFPNLKIIALGGIVTNKQIKEIKNTKAYGFASIRYFV